MEGTCCYQFLPLTTARFLDFYLCQSGQWHLPPPSLPPMQSVLGTFPDGLGAIFSIYILYFDFIFICLLMVSFLDATYVQIAKFTKFLL